MVRTFFFLLALTLIPSFAGATTSYDEMDVCLGSTAIIKAPKDHAFWYTEPKFGMGWPNMAAEGEVANTVGAIKEGDEFTPVNYAIFPNSNAFEDMAMDKNSPAWNPMMYMDLVRSRPSQVAVHSRTTGERLLVLWASNLMTGEIETHYVKVNARQCGVTTSIPVNNIAQMCEGGALVSPQGAKLTSDGDSVLVFRGASSGMTAIGAVSEGRARISAAGRRSDGATFIAEVRPEGTFPCPSAEVADLEPIEGDNDFALELCRGELWVAPADNGVDFVSTSGNHVWAERSDDGRSFALMGQLEGETAVQVTFGDDTAMRLMVNVVSCD